MLTKTTIIAALLCALSMDGMGQKTFFGIKSGINISSMSTSGAQTDVFQKTKSLIGYNFAGWFGYKLSSKARLSIEPGYVVKGTAFEGSSDRIKLQYIDFPVLFEYEIAKDFNLLGGPSLGYLISAKRKGNDGNVDVTNIYNESTEISGIVGFSYELSFFMDIGMRYNFGFTKVGEQIFADSQGVITGKQQEHNRYLQFLIRFKIAN